MVDGVTLATSMPPSSAKKKKRKDEKSFNIEIDIFGHRLSHILAFQECQTFALASKITYSYAVYMAQNRADEAHPLNPQNV